MDRVNSLRKQLAGSPAWARILPFAGFILLGSLQGAFGPASVYWMYLLKTVVGAAVLWLVWPLVAEMRWKLSGAAVLVGVAVVVMWIGIDTLYPKTSEVFVKLGLAKAKTAEQQVAAVWNPVLFFEANALAGWSFVGIRLLGSSLVVPPLEEVFFRSFLYRYVANADFMKVPLDRFLPLPFVVTVLFFGLEHEQWLAGILCGAAYQGLVIWKGRLGDAMTAHAITNFLLGLYIALRGAWQFW